MVDEDFEAIAEVEVDAGGDGDFGFGEIDAIDLG